MKCNFMAHFALFRIIKLELFVGEWIGNQVFCGKGSGGIQEFVPSKINLNVYFCGGQRICFRWFVVSLNLNFMLVAGHGVSLKNPFDNPVGFSLLFSQAQIIAPTTDEEYNYGAVGYKIQLNAKLETKEGYSIKKAEGCEESDRKIEFVLLYRDGENQPCAVILAYTKIRNAPLYFCIPTANASPALWDKFYKSLSLGTDNPAEQLQFFTTCLSRLLMGFAANKQ
ncbi:MAG: hypothetical protein IPP71_15290 [Bacteroidetes bacterium]|nr:hypothetical protein [Bacteroidota bacterium]